MDERTYGISVSLDANFDVAEREIREALAAEGFGVLTDIDVAATLRKNSGCTGRRTRSSAPAIRSWRTEPCRRRRRFGLLLPCNVILYRKGERTVVAALDPPRMMELAGNPGLEPVATEARAGLERAQARLEAWTVSSSPQPVFTRSSHRQRRLQPMQPAISDRHEERLAVEVVVVRSRGCHLCEDAIEALDELGCEFPLRVRVVQLETPEGRAIMAKHRAGLSPAVVIEGELFSSGRLPRKKLRRMLERTA